MSYTPSNIVQSNEYYPYGLQTVNSWTRANTTGNNFLANAGTELNTTSQLYDLEFRNYDPILGRLHQVDPMADKYASLSPYHFSFNNPAMFTDANGADVLWGLYTREEYARASMGRDQAWSHGGATGDLSPEAMATQLYGAESYGKWQLKKETTYYRVTYFCAACENDSGGRGYTYYAYESEEAYYLTYVMNDEKQNSTVTFFAGSPDISNYTKDPLFWINAALGFTGVGVAYQGDFWKTNELWHLQKNGILRFRWDAKWNHNFVTNSRLGSLKATSGFRNFSNGLAVASLVLTGANVIRNGEVRASDLLNTAMAGISFTGIGSIVAGAYFLTDLGFTYFTGKSLGDRLDKAVGGPVLDLPW